MRPPARLKSSNALKIKRGNVTVKIYPGRTKAGTKAYPFWTVVWYEGAKRIRQNFSDLQDAKIKAEEAATKGANGESAALRFSGADSARYLQAKELLRPFGKEDEVNLVVSEYVSAVKRLPQGVSLREVVDTWLKRNSTALDTKTVEQAVTEMIQTKRNAGRSDVHLKDMKSRLGAFADTFKMNIADLTSQQIQQYLDGLGLSGRTQKNHLRHITGLFKFAIKRKWLTKDALEEIQAIEEPKEDISEIGIFAPPELQMMFDIARPEMVTWLAIAAFAGLRSAELERLDWSEINLKERHIRVVASKAKTRSNRFVPIPENLHAWLNQSNEAVGKVVPFENMANQIEVLAKDINTVLRGKAAKEGWQRPEKWKWKRNALRHSYISYRLAIIKDVARVSLEAGNSPNMVFQHYRQLVTENEAMKWFAIAPLIDVNTLPNKAVEIQHTSMPN